MKVKNCRKWQKVDSIQEASKIIRQTIDNDSTMGSTKWYGYKDNGIVVNDAMVILGRISYNGRIWDSKEYR